MVVNIAVDIDEIKELVPFSISGHFFFHPATFLLNKGQDLPILFPIF